MTQQADIFCSKCLTEKATRSTPDGALCARCASTAQLPMREQLRSVERDLVELGADLGKVLTKVRAVLGSY